MYNEFSISTTSDEAPKIEINLANANSKYNWGTKTTCFDMSWYAPYKPTVDSFLSAILWGFFIWRTFVHLPNIINGVSSVSKMGGGN